MARALACAGRLDEATQHIDAARAVPMVDPEDGAIREADLLAGPWYGLDVTPSDPAPWRSGRRDATLNRRRTRCLRGRAA